MNAGDLNQIRKVVKEEVSQIIDERISVSEKRMTGIIDNRVSVSEKRIITDIEKRMGEKIVASEKRIIVEVGTFISEHVFPLIDEKADKADIEKLERKLDKSLDTGIAHERRIRDIERISIIAHQLRPKRSKGTGS